MSKCPFCAPENCGNRWCPYVNPEVLDNLYNMISRVYAGDTVSKVSYQDMEQIVAAYLKLRDSMGVENER